MRAEREPQYEWERPAWYWDVGDPARVARIMAAVRRGVSLSDASEIK
jgi:glycine cleavage system aminomethyltransferase T